MPRGDRTGPLGMGPMTGRAAGYCAGDDDPGYANPNPGHRVWVGGWWWPCWGWGGRGWRHWYYATGLPRWARWGYPPLWWGPTAPAAPSREEQMEMLRNQADWLKQQLEAINQRLADLEKASEEGGR